MICPLNNVLLQNHEPHTPANTYFLSYIILDSVSSFYLQVYLSWFSVFFCLSVGFLISFCLFRKDCLKTGFISKHWCSRPPAAVNSVPRKHAEKLAFIKRTLEKMWSQHRHLNSKQQKISFKNITRSNGIIIYLNWFQSCCIIIGDAQMLKWEPAHVTQSI